MRLDPWEATWGDATWAESKATWGDAYRDKYAYRDKQWGDAYRDKKPTWGDATWSVRRRSSRRDSSLALPKEVVQDIFKVTT